MSIKIMQSSPQAVAVMNGEPKPQAVQPIKYPFDELEKGTSFTIPLDECNWKSLRTVVYQRNAKYRRADGTCDKEFLFIKHDDLGLVEVARIK